MLSIFKSYAPYYPTLKTVTMKDMEGTEFTVPKKIERIISTAPSRLPTQKMQ